jgi:hypothetical protein
MNTRIYLAFIEDSLDEGHISVKPIDLVRDPLSATIV